MSNMAYYGDPNTLINLGSNSTTSGYVYTTDTTPVPQIGTITWTTSFPYTLPEQATWEEIKLEEYKRQLINLNPKKPKKEFLPITTSEENIDYYLNGK